MRKAALLAACVAATIGLEYAGAQGAAGRIDGRITFEGTAPAPMLVVESGVNLLGLAALDDQARPQYDRQMAQKMVNLGASVGAMTPGELAAWVGEKLR